MSNLSGIYSATGYIERVYGSDNNVDTSVRYDVRIESNRFSGLLKNILPVRAIPSPMILERTARVFDPCIIAMNDNSSEVRLVVFTEVYAAESC